MISASTTSEFMASGSICIPWLRSASAASGVIPVTGGRIGSVTGNHHFRRLLRILLSEMLLKKGTHFSVPGSEILPKLRKLALSRVRDARCIGRCIACYAGLLGSGYRSLGCGYSGVCCLLCAFCCYVCC